MSLRDFFHQHREELLQACNVERTSDASVDRLARDLCELLDEPVSATSAKSSSEAQGLLGDAPSVRRVRAEIDQLSRRSRMPVLFFGEVGTGKRHSARLLHARTYPDGEFFELNNNAQLALLEQKLAALRVPSSASAIGGMSVYVSELSDASKAVQASLAKLLREQRLRLRLIASSRLPLLHACREGTLRSDLVFGFSTTVELPNLRDRLEDLPVLTSHFATNSSNGRGAPLVFSEAALEVLASHVWPGNLIELSQLIERLQRVPGIGTIQPEHLTELRPSRSGMVINLPPKGIDLAHLERDLLLQALALTDNNRSRAARLLGLTRDQIRYRLSKLDLASGDQE
jgi:two-component system response regulator AtoC